MHRQAAILVVAVAVVAGVGASALYAQDRGHDGMMGSGGMKHMMGMMQQMGRMMDHCDQMMSGNPRDGGRPNDQWRKDPPASPAPNR
jgi:hypothetical protein